MVTVARTDDPTIIGLVKVDKKLARVQAEKVRDELLDERLKHMEDRERGFRIVDRRKIR